jgi:hypothetical protein
MAKAVGFSSIEVFLQGKGAAGKEPIDGLPVEPAEFLQVLLDLFLIEIEADLTLENDLVQSVWHGILSQAAGPRARPGWTGDSVAQIGNKPGSFSQVCRPIWESYMETIHIRKDTGMATSAAAR